MSSESDQGKNENTCVTVEKVVAALAHRRNTNGISLRSLEHYIVSNSPAHLSPEEVNQQVRRALKRGIEQGMISMHSKRARGDAGDADWMTTRMHPPSATRNTVIERMADAEDGGKAKGRKELKARTKTKYRKMERKEDKSKKGE